METGFRPDRNGKLVPRDIINTFVCTYNGVEVFRADLHPAIAANPFICLLRPSRPRAAPSTFTWTDDDGKIYAEKASIVVE